MRKLFWTENEVAPPDTIDVSVSKAISTARLAKEPTMTQKDLAQKINETAAVIQSYESAFTPLEPSGSSLTAVIDRRQSCTITTDVSQDGASFGRQAEREGHWCVTLALAFVIQLIPDFRTGSPLAPKGSKDKEPAKK